MGYQEIRRRLCYRMAWRKGEREFRPDRANAESERERVNVGGEEGRARTWKGTHRGRKNETEKGRKRRGKERESDFMVGLLVPSS